MRMAAGLGAESLAAKFRAGDGQEGHLGRWLLLQVAGGDVEAEESLATSRQIPPIRTVVGEKLNMEDIGTGWYPWEKGGPTGRSWGRASRWATVHQPQKFFSSRRSRN